MVSVISRCIIKTLCDNQGCLDFKRLDEKISQSFTVAEPVLQSVLFDDGIIAIQEGREKAAAGKKIQPDSLIVAKTSLRICQKKMCQHCDKLHLCRFFVCGGCTFGEVLPNSNLSRGSIKTKCKRIKCKNPHSLASAHNAELLKRNDLQYLSEKQLFQLLLQNDPYLLPEICPHYNRGDGLHGSCMFTTSCTKLHVCQHYLQDDCKFGLSCKRSHHVDQGMKIFQGFSQENIQNLFKIYRNKLIIMEQKEPRATAVSVPPTQQFSDCKPGLATSSACPSKPMSDADRNEICLYFIRQHCSFKEKCAHVHWRLPYKWQVLDSDGVTWKDLPNMEDIEKAYCDPEHETGGMDQPSPTNPILEFPSVQSSQASVVPAVNFMTMTYGQSPVRRQSTASSVSKPPHFTLTTEWLWYWKDDSGKWLEFGQSDGDTQASVTSQTLENMYLADRDTEINFGAGNQQYIVHFKGSLGTQMYQQNVNSKNKREIRRRPRFVSAQDVELMLKSASSHSSSSSTAESFPSHWDKNALPDIGYKLVPLSKSAREYDMVEMLFKRTMPLSRINNIQRIQNRSLWEVFQWQKEQMKKRNGGNAVNQQYLFHGSDKSLFEAICEHNFDWRICGVHGTSYGKGSYFARDASFSDKHSSIKRSLTKIMFVALVLVGEHIQGRCRYVRPPPKEDGKTFYDSCVDCESNPSIYVVFEKQQIYPAYLINYS